MFKENSFLKSSRVVIHLENVDVHLGNRLILEEIGLSIEQGEFVYLVGPTGSGKSTLLKLLYADCPFSEGEIQIGDFFLSSLEKKEIPFLRRKMGIIFQDFQLLPDRNVYENIRFALRATGWRSSSEIKARISEVLMRVGMWSQNKAMPHQLSGGEQQRVAIARALINDPAVLIADEPTGNLDPEAAYHLMNILRKINQGGTTVLMATHEYILIRDFPARVLALSDHRLESLDSPDAFLRRFLEK
jgi:cell division transport system ATP-binding protein